MATSIKQMGVEPLVAGDWKVWSLPDAFIENFGPLWYLEQRENGKVNVRVGLSIEQRHCNRFGMCHGMVLAGLADYALGFNCAYVDGPYKPGPTINLNLDFVRPVPTGAWLEGESQIVRSTKRINFVEGRLRTNAGICVRTNAMFQRLGPDSKFSIRPPDEGHV